MPHYRKSDSNSIRYCVEAMDVIVLQFFKSGWRCDFYVLESFKMIRQVRVRVIFMKYRKIRVFIFNAYIFDSFISDSTNSV